MNKTVALFSVLLASSFAFAQASPKLMKSAVVFQTNNTPGAPKSFDEFIPQSKSKCLSRIAKQMKNLSEDNDKNYHAFNKLIGERLKQFETSCNHYRFEMIEKSTEVSVKTETTNFEFAYRCYETAEQAKQTGQRVAQTPVFTIQPHMLLNNVDDQKETEAKLRAYCDYFYIAGKLSVGLGEELAKRDAKNSKASQKSTSQKVKSSK